MIRFFLDEDDNESKIEYHYLSSSKRFGIVNDDFGKKNFYNEYGILRKQESIEEDSDLQDNDFKRLISKRIKKLLFGEKYSNIVFLAGAGASVVTDNPVYGKTVQMIAENIFMELANEKNYYNLEELAKKCNYNNGEILAENKLAENFNLEDFLSTLLNYYQFMPKKGKIRVKRTIERILHLIKKNTSYSYNKNDLRHGALLKVLSELSGKDGNKFSVITTNYDVLIEEAASENNFIVFDGFNFTSEPKFDSTMFEWNLVRNVNNINTKEVEYKDNTFNLIKIHGSLTWERGEKGEIVRKNKDSINDLSKMVMIFPSSDKFAQSYQNPYFELFTKFQELIRRPNTLLITAGFSFADNHISKMITQAMINNHSLKILVTDFNIDPLRIWNKTTKKYDSVLNDNSKYNGNWEELLQLMNDGYPITFLKSTLNGDLIEYMRGDYLDDEY